jgi:cyclopropane-fatty-acyl-phospholipid synthase
MVTYLPVLLVIILILVFIGGWMQQERSKNAGWVDVIWAFGVAGTALIYSIAGSGDERLRWLTGAIYTVWFCRLGWHLARRVSKDSTEDGRYAFMRQWAGPRAPLVFFVFYLMQASWVWLFALPAWLLAQGEWPGLGWAMLALLVAIVAWVGESLADRQLQQFKSQPVNHGKTCRNGLWRYSRHPNYFFEWCHWFVYPLLGIASAAGGWLWLAPLFMFVFLYFVTGIPFTEQQALRSRGNDYREYQLSTPMFFPWKPKHIEAKPRP